MCGMGGQQIPERIVGYCVLKLKWFMVMNCETKEGVTFINFHIDNENR